MDEQTPVEYARELKAIWRHLPEDEMAEQIVAHMESQGYEDDEIADALEAVGVYRSRWYRREFFPAAN